MDKALDRMFQVYRSFQKSFCALLCLTVSSLLFASPLSADNRTILLVSPSNTVASNFKQQLQAQLPAFHVHHSSTENLSLSDIKQANTVVTLGTKSLLAVQQHPVAIPTIATYLSQYKQHAEIRKTPWLTRFYTSPSLEHQLLLSKILLPKATTFGVLLSDSSRHYLSELEPLAQSMGFKIISKRWNGDASLHKTLNQLLADVDFLLAVEDNTIYNRNTIKSILLSSYRRKRVVIGPSPSYVKAGSLATTSCSTEEVVSAVAGAILQRNQNYTHSGDRSLHCHSVKVNEHVARSLSISVPDEFHLMKHDLKEASQ